MKFFFSFIIGICCSIHSYAQCTGATPSGPNNGTAFANISSGNWTTPNNVGTSDNLYSTVFFPANALAIPPILKVTGFGFSIPAGSTICGITIGVEIRGSGLQPNMYVQAVKGGTPAGSILSSAVPGTDSYINLGNASNLWGNTWTVTDINSANFGLSIFAYPNDASADCTVLLDHVRITVHYTTSTPLTFLDIQATSTPSNTKVLTWKTTEERNVSHFEVEKSIDGNTFHTIGRIEAKGSFSSVNDYIFEDFGPSGNLTYYRVKEIDHDLQFMYSSITSTLHDIPIAVIQQSDGSFFVSTDEKVEQIVVMDVTGRQEFFYSENIVTTFKGVVLVTVHTNHNIVRKKFLVL